METLSDHLAEPVWAIAKQALNEAAGLKGLLYITLLKKMAESNM